MNALLKDHQLLETNSDNSPQLQNSTTQAFGWDYVPGIYINDQDRFGGPIAQANVEALVEEIIAILNNSSIAQKHGLQAIPYRSSLPNARYQKVLPDIWINHPDDIFFRYRGSLEQSNEHNLKPLPDVLPNEIRAAISINEDMHTAIKGRHPIFSVDAKSAECVSENDRMDLTLAYKIVERLL